MNYQTACSETPIIIRVAYIQRFSSHGGGFLMANNYAFRGIMSMYMTFHTYIHMHYQTDAGN